MYSIIIYIGSFTLGGVLWAQDWVEKISSPQLIELLYVIPGCQIITYASYSTVPFLARARFQNMSEDFRILSS